MLVQFIESNIQMFPELSQESIVDQDSDDNCDRSLNRSQRDRQNVCVVHHGSYRSPNVYSALPA